MLHTVYTRLPRVPHGGMHASESGFFIQPTRTLFEAWKSRGARHRRRSEALKSL